MSTISLQDIGLPPAVRRAAERKVRKQGQSPPEYLRSLVERDLLADQTFDELLAPVRKDFARAGVSEADVDQLVARGAKVGRCAPAPTKASVVSGRRPRAVFDCNVFVQAVLGEAGPAAQCVRHFESGAVELFVSRATLRELRAVLQYPQIRKLAPSLTELRIDAFVDRIAYRAVIVRRVRHVLDYPRARQDEPYIDLVVAAKADYLISRDKDLLSLMTGHSAICTRFRQLTAPLRVLTPVEFLTVFSHRDPAQ